MEFESPSHLQGTSSEGGVLVFNLENFTPDIWIGAAYACLQKYGYMVTVIFYMLNQSVPLIMGTRVNMKSVQVGLEMFFSE